MPRNATPGANARPSDIVRQLVGPVATTADPEELLDAVLQAEERLAAEVPFGTRKLLARAGIRLLEGLKLMRPIIEQHCRGAADAETAPIRAEMQRLQFTMQMCMMEAGQPAVTAVCEERSRLRAFDAAAEEPVP